MRRPRLRTALLQNTLIITRITSNIIRNTKIIIFQDPGQVILGRIITSALEDIYTIIKAPMRSLRPPFFMVKYKNMKHPNFGEEKKLWNKGYKYVIGLDEAGRGSLAGPVVAGAVLFNNFQFSISRKVKDSKMLSPKQREEIYNALAKHPDIEWGIGIVSEKIIDKINIFEATKQAMKKAVKDLKKRVENNSGQKIDDRQFSDRYCFLILDGNFKLNINLPQKAIIKADQKVFSCALASIFAKATRDKIMQKYHKKYPLYGFDRHKGYGTASHFKTIAKYGPCKIHRKTFYPIRASK